MVRRFLLGRIPVYTNGALNVVDVGDVARGHLLADERGLVGERYILGNRNYTTDRLFADLARLSGVEPPALKLDPTVALRLGAGASRRRRPTAARRSASQEIKLTTSWWTYRNTKAKRELGFQAVAARGHDRGDRRLVPRARGRPARALAPDAAGAVEGLAAGAAARSRARPASRVGSGRWR